MRHTLATRPVGLPESASRLDFAAVCREAWSAMSLLASRKAQVRTIAIAHGCRAAREPDLEDRCSASNPALRSWETGPVTSKEVHILTATDTAGQHLSADALGAAARRERGLVAARRVAITVWALVVVFRTWTTGLAFNRELLLLYICTGLIAASIGRRRVLTVVRDWLPFALVLVVYDLTRGAADVIGMPTLWQTQPAVDRWLFFGAMPTVWLQEHLKMPDPPWWEVIVSTTYMSFFILPYVVAGVLWLRECSGRVQMQVGPAAGGDSFHEVVGACLAGLHGAE